jgi:hypothetical protein
LSNAKLPGNIETFVVRPWDHGAFLISTVGQEKLRRMAIVSRPGRVNPLSFMDFDVSGDQTRLEGARKNIDRKGRNDPSHQIRVKL